MTIVDKPDVQQSTPTIIVTPVAAEKIQEIMHQRELGADHALRVFVAGGGCSGLQYGMAFENNIGDYDTLIDADNGVRLVVDATSMMYIDGATIDFVESLMGGGFRIDNPQAVSSCGCGTSFRTKDSGAAADDAAGGCGTCGSA
ncbi:MAG: HesB/IscA family protein [Anaerolineales bacterium]